jgi:hypothetical protein
MAGLLLLLLLLLLRDLDLGLGVLPSGVGLLLGLLWLWLGLRARCRLRRLDWSCRSTFFLLQLLDSRLCFFQLLLHLLVFGELSAWRGLLGKSVGFDP